MLAIPALNVEEVAGVELGATVESNDLTIGWQNLNLLNHPNATLAPQTRESRASGEN